MNKILFTQYELKQIVSYDMTTGEFTWIKNKIRKIIGAKAGYINDRGYVQIMLNGKNYKAHRIAWLYVHGTEPEGDIDHINRVRNDNRIVNLRLANRSQNCANRIKTNRNTSGYMGVTYVKNRNKWQAQVMVNRKQIFLGYFDTPEQAHQVYKKYKEASYGEFTNA
jgi:hypothetical protein